jgi:hypothetical protein
MMGSLFHNANSGKKIIRRICKMDGKKFVAQHVEKTVMFDEGEYEKAANQASVS